MPYRVFLHDGKVTDRIDQYEDARYLSSDADAAAEVALALNVSISAIAVEHVEAAPAPAVTIPPTVSAPATPTLEEKVDAILAALPADVKVAVDAALAPAPIALVPKVLP